MITAFVKDALLNLWHGEQVRADSIERRCKSGARPALEDKIPR